MNGRIYDGRLGRFLQADPHIQEPNNSQSLNRYSYVINNPLSYTDPTGYFFMKKLWNKIRPFVGVIVAVVINAYCKGCALELIGAWAGAAGAAANGGNVIQGFVLGAFTAGMGTVNNFAAAFAGGFASVVQGGKFGRGFASAGLGASIGGGGKGMTAVISSALVGGTISRVTGGKFKNGAISAAFAAAISTDWNKGASKSDGEWIFPEGGSTDMNDYDSVMTNGINGDRKAFALAVDREGIPGFYNPSKGFIADIFQSFKQKFFGWAGDSMARDFANGLAGVDHPMRIIGHSQGTLTVANAAQYYGLPTGSSFVMKSPALSYFSASRAVSVNGGSLQYIQSFGDGANIWAPSFNPINFVSGVRDIFCGFCTHTANGL